MIKMSKSIGIIDSGLGGYTFYHTLTQHFPDKSFTLIVDQANAPFGEKSKEELLEIGTRLLNKMVQMNIETILFGCNTLSAATFKELETEFPELNLINIIDITVKEVKKDANRILVIGTSATIKQKSYSRALSRHAKNSWINEHATPKLVPLIEGLADDEDIDTTLQEILEGKTKVDTLVLGCTHYPLIKKNIQKLTKAKIVDSLDASLNYFKKLDLPDGDSTIYTTLDAKRFEHQIKTLFGTQQKVREIKL